MFKRIVIGARERGLLFSHGDFVRWLRPGVHWVFGFGVSAIVQDETRDVALRARPRVVERLMSDPDTWTELAFAHPRDHERAIVRVDGQVAFVVGRGPAAFFRHGREVDVELVDARSVLVQGEVAPLLAASGGPGALEELCVPSGSVGLLTIDEKYSHELGPGRYAVWRGIARTRFVVEPVVQLLERARVRVLTRDLARVRLDVVVRFRIAEPALWLVRRDASWSALGLALELSARELAGRRTLDRLLGGSLDLPLEWVVGARASREGACVLEASVRHLEFERLPREPRPGLVPPHRRLEPAQGLRWTRATPPRGAVW